MKIRRANQGSVKAITLLVVAGALSILAGCKDKPAAEVVQTVDWYKAHRAELDEVMKKCKSNPGELGSTPNCINAREAVSAIAHDDMFGPRKGK